MRHQWVLLTPHLTSPTNYLPLAVVQKRLPESTWRAIELPLGRVLRISQERLSLTDEPSYLTRHDASSCHNMAARLEYLYRGNDRSGRIRENLAKAQEAVAGVRTATSDQYRLMALIARGDSAEACWACDKAVKEHAKGGREGPTTAFAALRVQLSALPGGVPVENLETRRLASRALECGSGRTIASHIFDAGVVARVLGRAP